MEQFKVTTELWKSRIWPPICWSYNATSSIRVVSTVHTVTRHSKHKHLLWNITLKKLAFLPIWVCLTYIARTCFQKRSIFNHFICHAKQRQLKTLCYANQTWGWGSVLSLANDCSVKHILFFLFFFNQLNLRRNLIQMRYKWVWYNGANWEFSVLRWGPTSSQPVFQQARLCQTRQSRVHSLPETRAVWLSSCYWLLFSVASRFLPG